MARITGTWFLSIVVALAVLTGTNEQCVQAQVGVPPPIPGSIVAWGDDGYGQTTNVPVGNDFVAIAAGGIHSLALRPDGSLVGWGDDSSGQTTNVPLGNDFVAIAAGASHSLALRSNGSLVGWGFNNFGQSNVPPGNDFVAISAGFYQGLALRSNGLLVAWGDNRFGQLDDIPDGNFAAIAAGGFHHLALRSNGTLFGWGFNNSNTSTVPAGNNFVAVAAGYGNSLALRSDRSMVIWGWNVFGQTDNVPTGNDFVAIAVGGLHSLAIRGSDTTPPETTVTSSVDGTGAAVASGGATLSSTMTIQFGGTDIGGVAGFQCELDGGGFTACTSPKTYSALAIGNHTFKVRAVDAAGNIDPTPAIFTWTRLTPAQAIQNLITTIGNLGLPNGVATSLRATLNNINTNNQSAACAKIYAFITKVGVDLKRGALTPAQATLLLVAANSIADSLDCAP